MSTLKIKDLPYFAELDSQEVSINGAAAAGASAAANYNDAVAAAAATDDGSVSANANGSYSNSYYDPYYGYSSYSSGGPSASAFANDRYYYYY